jgi:hypothetical protein
MCQHCSGPDHDEDQDALAAELMRRQAAKAGKTAAAKPASGADHALVYRPATAGALARDDR